MTFEWDGQIWQVIEYCQNGVIAVRVVGGKRTTHRGYFPNALPQAQRSPISSEER